ncbi:hypothetical protein NG831_20915 [Xanthomonas sacchari]|uniref:RHS repeat-associated core domain-containing protein n=1 Tax=Xanthomonas sacchari TaxID=56458 RepID=UPI002253E8DD|nr:RHS repeat-associated core domain-containing protein [Xanthomonas sacchari]MCW0410500.1 hypothetical protein [Xanthomonas sacchari]UYK66524.1 hypothetical protein NG831_20915 [Xanthomonas sacchari]
MSNFQRIRTALSVMAAVALPLLVTLSASAQTVRYVHTDGLASPVLMTDKDRSVVERSEYEPYGSLLNRPIMDKPGYAGHVMDTSTGFAYMQQRYYDPGVGRFLSVDPVEANGKTGANFNRYKYALNNPYRFTDPDGRCESVATCQMMRDDLDLASGRMTQQEASDRRDARGVGALIAAPVGFATLAAPEVAAGSGLMATVKAVFGFGERKAAQQVLQTTAHGAERLAGQAATRGGVLSAQEVRVVMQTGRTMTQADGAAVRIVTNDAGRSSVVVSGERGVITTFKNISEKSLNRLAKRYGWE